MPELKRAFKADTSSGSTFLKIPLELRNAIYKDYISLCDQSEDFVPTRTGIFSPMYEPIFKPGDFDEEDEDKRTSVLDLFLINRQVHTEASRVFYPLLRFGFANLWEVEGFCERISGALLAQIRHVILHVHVEPIGNMIELRTDNIRAKFPGLESFCCSFMLTKDWLCNGRSVEKICNQVIQFRNVRDFSVKHTGGGSQIVYGGLWLERLRECGIKPMVNDIPSSEEQAMQKLSGEREGPQDGLPDKFEVRFHETRAVSLKECSEDRPQWKGNGDDSVLDEKSWRDLMAKATEKAREETPSVCSVYDDRETIPPAWYSAGADDLSTRSSSS